MANEKINTTQDIITPPVGDHEKEEDLLAALESIPEEDIMRMWAKMDEEERIKNEEERRQEEERREESEVEKLKWDTDAILNDLEENHVTIEHDVEMMWHEWKKVHIELPAVWDFEWFKFDCFVSYDYVTKEDFEAEPELEKKSYSMSDISKLLHAMNKYMAELKWKNDWDMDYEKELIYGKTDNDNCNAWDCLRTIAWLYSWYWLSDKIGKKYRRKWFCHYDSCVFCRNGGYSDSANLFLRLSD